MAEAKPKTQDLVTKVLKSLTGMGVLLRIEGVAEADIPQRVKVENVPDPEFIGMRYSIMPIRDEDVIAPNCDTFYCNVPRQDKLQSMNIFPDSEKVRVNYLSKDHVGASSYRATYDIFYRRHSDFFKH